MREALSRFMKRRIGRGVVVPEFDRFRPFPLSPPAEQEALNKPAYGANERAFYEGSVMIW